MPRSDSASSPTSSTPSIRWPASIYRQAAKHLTDVQRWGYVRTRATPRADLEGSDVPVPAAAFETQP